MKNRIFILLLILLNFGCTAQNSVETNTIITTENYKMGVISESGDLLIDTIYNSVSLFYNKGRQSLPPVRTVSKETVEFYKVRNDDNQYAIFDKNGQTVFDFADCINLQVDEYTQTIVKMVKQPDNRFRSYLYDFKNQLIFEASFEHIYYINESDLIALIAEDGQNEEYYLYNPFTKKKSSVYTHFNIFNQDTNLPFGMKETDFEKYKSLNIISVRQEKDNEYIWGLVDMKGNELLPMKYKYFRILTDDLKKRFIERATKPEGVNFLFYSHQFGDNRQMYLFDENMEIYQFDGDKNEISKAEK